MLNQVKKIMPQKLKNDLYTTYNLYLQNKLNRKNYKKFTYYSFSEKKNINSFEQLEARISKSSHSIEKGLSYKSLRLGFGKEVLEKLLYLMRLYIELGYDKKEECYQIALSTLLKYIEIHERNNYPVIELKRKVTVLGELNNHEGGVKEVKKSVILKEIEKDYKAFSTSRVSVREFSKEPVDTDLIIEAITLAQKTPSACNRQSWTTRIIEDNKLKEIIRNNQNGNKGFGENIDKFILITTDEQYFDRLREKNQTYIDGGMYSMSLLNSLHYYGIASIPLSASLSFEQEKNVRKNLQIKDSENLMLFIGVGNYVDEFKVPKSTRRKPRYYIL